MVKNDSYKWIKGEGPYYPDAHKHLGNILGEELMAEYGDIFHLLALIFLDINTRYVSTGRFSALFNYDEEPVTSGLGAAVSVVRKTALSRLVKKAEKLPLRVDFIHRVEFEEVSGHRVLIKRGPGNRGPTECGTTHEATSGMSS